MCSSGREAWRLSSLENRTGSAQGIATEGITEMIGLVTLEGEGDRRMASVGGEQDLVVGMSGVEKGARAVDQSWPIGFARCPSPKQRRTTG